MAEEAKATLGELVTVLEAALPADICEMPIDELSAPQALGRASLVGARQLVRIVELPLDPDNLKQMRLIGDMALGANKIFQRAAQGERNHDMIGRLLAAIEAEKAAPAE